MSILAVFLGIGAGNLTALLDCETDAIQDELPDLGQDQVIGNVPVDMAENGTHQEALYVRDIRTAANDNFARGRDLSKII